MLNSSPDGVGSELRERRRIVVVYEDNAAREHAAQCAADLPGTEPGGSSGSVRWWPFATLRDSAHAAEVAADAAIADLVIFAVCPEGDFPGEVKLWMETWLAKRSNREGSIVGLVVRQTGPGELACLKEVYLRHLALRMGMDYLSQMPSGSARAMPDSPDSCRERAHQVTSVLDSILRSGQLPPTLDLK